MRRLALTPSTARAAWPLLVACAAVLAAGCRARLPLPVDEPAPVVAVRATPARFDRDVRLLRSEDFVERSRAAERLVSAGEVALPALGAAGEGTVRVLGNQSVGTTAPVVRTILADVDVDRLVRHLDSPWPVIRRETASELGRRGRLRAVPFLIPRMEDDDAEVRAASASSLRRLTNRFFGFDATSPVRARRQATDRWREWWSIEGRVRAERQGNGAG